MHVSHRHQGIQQALKINGTECNERHLVKQSQLPDNQSPCNSREDEGKHRDCELMIAQSCSRRKQGDAAVCYPASSEQRLSVGLAALLRRAVWRRSEGDEE
jgi:hypothetical protein